MCLVNFHFQDHPIYSLIVAANRDEFYERPTATAKFWEDEPSILAGRDLLQMGTWLGVTKDGRFAALTNYRDPKRVTGQFSRGDIVRDFLAKNDSPQGFVQHLQKSKAHYAGYNIIIGGAEQLLHYNNVLDEINEIPPGTHSLSNHTLNTPWPKVVQGKKQLSEYVQSCQGTINVDSLFDILINEAIAEDELLPQTGVGLEMERSLSPLFIKLPTYGTRSSTVLLIDKSNRVSFVERTYLNGEFHSEKRFSFTIDVN